MGFGLSSNNDKEDIYESLKLLATNVETLNRQISGGGGPGGNNSNLEPKLDMIINGINSLSSKLYAQNVGIEKKVDTHHQMYVNDKRKLDSFIERNMAMLDLLKATLTVLNEIVTIMKERENQL